MRKILIVLSLAGFLALSLAGVIAAEGTSGGGDVINFSTTLGAPDVPQVITRIINFLFALLIVIAVCAIIVSAILFITAAGNAERIGKARDFLIYSLIALVVGFLAKGLVKFIIGVVNTGSGS